MVLARKTASLAITLVGATFLLAGCLPVELSVSPSGTIVIPRQEGFCVYDPAAKTAKVVSAPKDQTAVFAQYSPDGKTLLVIGKEAGEGPGQGFIVATMPAQGGEATKVYSGTNITYARWSPDGKWIAVTRVSDQAKAPVKENLPELLVVNAAEGTNKTLLSNTSALQRWSADSKSLYGMEISAKKDNRYTGTLVRIDASSGKTTALADLVSDKVFLDVSPDGSKVLFTALTAGAVGTKLDDAEKTSHLFELTLGGQVRAVADKVSYAVYSPKGTKVLVASSGKNDQEGGKLEVFDAAMTKGATAASDAALHCGDGPTSVDVHPGWLDDQTVLYLRLHTVYGVAGKNIELTSVDAEGKKRTPHQATIDSQLK